MIEPTTSIELATSLNMSKESFERILMPMQALGFPSRSTKANDFDTAQILDWVVKQQEMNLSLVSMLAQKLSGGR